MDQGDFSGIAQIKGVWAGLHDQGSLEDDCMKQGNSGVDGTNQEGLWENCTNQGAFGVILCTKGPLGDCTDQGAFGRIAQTKPPSLLHGS